MNIKKESTANPPTAKDEPKTRLNSSDQSDAPHKPFQAAHDEFFQKIATIWEDAQHRSLDAQFELQRGLQQAWQSQDPKDFQDTHEKYQRVLEEAANDATALQRYADAYEEYKSAVAKALAKGTPGDLDPLTLSAIAQSLALVAQVAGQVPRPPQKDEAAR
jgi:beta-galactosidase/beta-glucuronidase